MFGRIYDASHFLWRNLKDLLVHELFDETDNLSIPGPGFPLEVNVAATRAARDNKALVAVFEGNNHRSKWKFCSRLGVELTAQPLEDRLLVFVTRLPDLGEQPLSIWGHRHDVLCPLIANATQRTEVANLIRSTFALGLDMAYMENRLTSVGIDFTRAHSTHDAGEPVAIKDLCPQPSTYVALQPHWRFVGRHCYKAVLAR